MIVPENMKLRKVQEADHEWLVELHNDPEVLKNITNPSPISLDDHLTWWGRVSNDPKQLRLIFEIDGVKTGFTKFYDINLDNKNCILGADIHKDFRGKGLAKYMWALMLERCFLDLGLHRVSLTTAEYNMVGRWVYSNLGFQQEGRLIESLYRSERFYDQVCMYLLKSQWEANK